MSKNEEKINITPEELNEVSGGFVEQKGVASKGWNVQCPYCYNMGPEDITINKELSTGDRTVYKCTHIQGEEHLFTTDNQGLNTGIGSYIVNNSAVTR